MQIHMYKLIMRVASPQDKIWGICNVWHLFKLRWKHSAMWTPRSVEEINIRGSLHTSTSRLIRVCKICKRPPMPQMHKFGSFNHWGVKIVWRFLPKLTQSLVKFRQTQSKQMCILSWSFPWHSNLCHLFKLRCKHLAMSTPRSVEVNNPWNAAC